ncbi:Glycosyltransferase family 25 (LPS biosynthesis protein), partial [Haemophilus influenzae]
KVFVDLYPIIYLKN